MKSTCSESTVSSQPYAKAAHQDPLKSGSMNSEIKKNDGIDDKEYSVKLNTHAVSDARGIVADDLMEESVSSKSIDPVNIGNEYKNILNQHVLDLTEKYRGMIRAAAMSESDEEENFISKLVDAQVQNNSRLSQKE